MVELRIVAGQGSGRTVIVGQFPFLIGRSAKAGLSISDPGVWEQHVTLRQQENGSFELIPEKGAVVTVDGKPIETHALRNGDVFDCGGARIRFWIAPGRARSLVGRELAVWIGIGLVVLAEVLLAIRYLD